MGIEALGNIGRAVSAAPAIGRVANIGPSFGRRIGVGIEGGFRVGSISNPFRGIGSSASFAENRGPSLLNPLGIETIRNPFTAGVNTLRRENLGSLVKPLQISVDRHKNVVRPAVLERKLSGWTGNLVRTPEPLVVRLPNPITNPFLAPKEESAPQSIVQTRAENKTTSRVVRTTSAPTQREVQTEQVVEEKKVVTEQKKDDPKTKKEKKQSLLKIKIVEAVKVTLLRLSAVAGAARKVKEEAEKKGEKIVITGKKLSRFLSGEFWKYISPLVGREGHDGTIALTLRAIEENPREYTSLEEAQSQLSKPVTEHIPLEKGEDGRLATWEEVREVLEGKEKESLKSQTPAEMVIKRVVIQKGETLASTGQAVNTLVEEKEAGEPTLKSLGLEELFPKAA